MKLCTVIIAALICTTGAHAQSPYVLDPGREWLLIGSGSALGISGQIVSNNVDPLTTVQISALNPSDVNGFDRGAIKPYRKALASDAITGVAIFLPLTFLANEQIRQDWKTVGVMWGETMLLQSGLNELVKGLFHRTRPYVYDEYTPINKKTTSDARASFYSGHTSTAAAMSFFTARVFSDYIEDRQARIVLWGAAVSLPVVVGVLRVEAGRHFPSDVIVGYVTGAAIGYLIPELHRAKTPKRISLEPMHIDGTPAMQLAYRF
ncbi:MAG: phosphatase PAP2 family protein [candidate division Zixibacteria bacterium]|nr:phosphatase PAP2 family protein [candidate division Zixibacteria bacterium]